MSSEVVRIHSSQACVIDTFLEQLYVCLADSPPSEVLQTLRSNIPGRSMEDSVGVYLPTARSYMDIDDKKLRNAVREVGGGWNTSSLFLPATSQETRVTSQTGKMRKSVAKIPRSKVAPHLIKKLDDLCSGTSAGCSGTSVPTAEATQTSAIIDDPFLTHDIDRLFSEWTTEVELRAVSDSEDDDVQSSDDDEDQLYYNFVQHFKKALRRDEFTLKDGEMGMQQERLSETESEEDIDDTDGSGSTLNTSQIVSLSSTATTTLIYPKEVDSSSTSCDAMCCNVEELKGKDIDWVQCDGCDSWLHAYCIGVEIEEIERMDKFYCENCNGRM